MRKIKGRKTEKSFKLNKNREGYKITAEDIIELAKQQKGSKMLSAIDGIARLIRDEKQVGEMEI